MINNADNENHAGNKAIDTTRAATILWDEYEVIELVGGGSFGHVYRCRNIKNGKYYAIKKFKNKFSSKK